MAQLAWVPRHLADLESDMSAIHRVDDIWSMPAARLFRMAWRLPHYQGVMRDAVLAEQHEHGENTGVQSWQAPAPQPRRQEPLPATKAVVMSDPALAGIFSFGGSGA